MKKTRRQWLRKVLEFGGTRPSTIVERLEQERDERLTVNQVIEEIEHLSRSLEGEKRRIEVKPPKCRDCGFDSFDNLLNVPSNCPECKSEWIEEPEFRLSG